MYVVVGRYKDASEDIEVTWRFLHAVYADELDRFNGSGVKNAIDFLQAKHGATIYRNRTRDKRDDNPTTFASRSIRTQLVPLPAPAASGASHVTSPRTSRRVRRCRLFVARTSSRDKRDLERDGATAPESPPGRAGVAVNAEGGVSRGEGAGGGRHVTHNPGEGTDGGRHLTHNPDADRLRRISHALHYCSIVILGMFVLQVSVSAVKKKKKLYSNIIYLFIRVRDSHRLSRGPIRQTKQSMAGSS